mmetsp:Transcript_6606/g.15112  ORF Transcript_6606/g.15112 Transcript_6606/m.15112 type:complete len:117 (+) Transcript_6606:1356-1706(+)
MLATSCNTTTARPVSITLHFAFVTSHTSLVPFQCLSGIHVWILWSLHIRFCVRHVLIHTQITFAFQNAASARPFAIALHLALFARQACSVTSQLFFYALLNFEITIKYQAFLFHWF